ncbi:MAG: dihydrofolate reductase family protein [Thaumarchaeota archaeon]|nr:dihydrofolate reductase family protein [Nitrososphaerota archaeon]
MNDHEEFIAIARDGPSDGAIETARTVTANLYMTLDGYGEFPKYPGSDAHSSEPGEVFKDLWIRRYNSVDTIIYGRRSYEDHVSYHSLSARKPSDPEYLFEFSRFLERSQKIVLSHNLKKTEWQNSRVMKGDLARIVSRLRAEPGKDIIVDAGPSVSQEFIQRGLVDDYRIMVMPVILGRGKLYWGSMIRQRTLKLLSIKTDRNGELVLHYGAVRSPPGR